jgi:hypothetical protein
MKIALCFSGQPRSFKEGYKYYKKNLLSKYDVDIFMHTWTSKYDEAIIKLYKPKLYIFEEPLKADFDSRYTNTPNAEKWPPRFTVSALYSMSRSLDLKMACEKENEFIYDWVIKTRTDYALNLVIPFDKLDPNKLYIPDCRMVPTRDFGNDQFAFGSSDIMNKRMSVFSNMDYFYTKGVQMIGEDMTSAQMKLNNLVGENLIYYDMKNPFPPGPHNGTPHSLIRDDYDAWTK